MGEAIDKRNFGYAMCFGLKILFDTVNYDS